MLDSRRARKRLLSSEVSVNQRRLIPAALKKQSRELTKNCNFCKKPYDIPLEYASIKKNQATFMDADKIILSPFFCKILGNLFVVHIFTLSSLN